MRAPVMTNDEIGHLASTFNLTLQRIEEHTEELAASRMLMVCYYYK